MKKKDQLEMDAEYARKLQEEEESLAQAKDAQTISGKTYDQIRLIFQARFDANMRFLLKSKEEMEKEEEEIIKSINETPAQKAAKRRRLREQAKEAEDLKKQLEVVADEDDDVFVEATSIGTKVPIVNSEIVMINNKPRVILKEKNNRRGCERPSNLESGFYKDIDKLGPSYKKGIERIDHDVTLEASRSGISEVNGEESRK
nr:hypothetical protein [Tanacetum cinerariifolium]